MKLCSIRNMYIKFWILLMLIVVVSEAFLFTFAKTSSKLHKGCDKTIRTTRLIRSPPVTSSNRNQKIHCVYRLVKFDVSELLYELNFKSFHVGNHHNDSWCSNGYLQIIDHPSRLNTSGYFCGRLRYSRTFLAETEQLALVFHSDSYSRQTYFRVQASVLPKRLAQERHKELVKNSPGEAVNGTYCDRIYLNCRGFCDVTSPNYPGFYPRNATCIYRILFNDTSNNDSWARVVLGGQYYDNFDVWGGPVTRCHSNFCSSKEITTTCPYDYVAIYDVAQDGDTNLIQTFCGRGHLPRIATSGSALVLKFASAAAGSISSDGFHLSVGVEMQRETNTGVLLRTGSCQWYFDSNRSDSGHFYNPKHWYPPGTRCSYRFAARWEHQRPFLHFTYFNANRANEGCQSKLTLYDSDGPDASSIRGVFCNHKQPNETILAKFHKFYIEFDSKIGSYDGSNFEYSVLYTFIDVRTSGSPVLDTICNENFSSSDGNRQGQFDFFQNRLRLRHRHVRCTMRFEGRPTERIRFIFTELQFDPTRQPNRACSSDAIVDDNNEDRLMVLDKNQRLIHCFGGGNIVHLPYEVVSSESFLELQLRLHNIPSMAYRSTETYAFRGIYEFLQVGCGQDYHSGMQGQLVFPSLSPQLLPSHVHCRWTIEVRHQHYIFIKFAYLSIAGNCSNNSLQLYAPWSKELRRELCHERDNQLEVEPLDLNIEVLTTTTITSKKTANKVILELNASSTARFKLLWTEVTLVKHQQPDDDDDCDYKCRNSNFCLAADLVCNGVINCPLSNSSWDPLDESISDCISINKLLTWVFATFSTSFIVVFLVASLLIWRKKCFGQSS